MGKHQSISTIKIRFKTQTVTQITDPHIPVEEYPLWWKTAALF
jgi:hypothetical protein